MPSLAPLPPCPPAPLPACPPAYSDDEALRQLVGQGDTGGPDMFARLAARWRHGGDLDRVGVGGLPRPPSSVARQGVLRACRSAC